jgi:hypothetical protein
LTEEPEVIEVKGENANQHQKMNSRLKLSMQEQKELLVFRRETPIKIGDINPILIIWTPRGYIKEANEAFSKIEYVDKLYLKYFDKPSVLKETQKFFSEHKEYTHMIIVVDDVECPINSVYVLMRTLLEHDLPILCGCFNFCNTGLVKWYCAWCEGNEPHKLLNVSFEPIDFEPKLDADSRINAFHFVAEEWRVKNQIIKKVWFQGFPLTIIRRDIYEKIGFRFDGSTDVPFAVDCAKEGIPQFCDFSLKLKHHARPTDRDLMVGKLPSEIVFEKAKSHL